MRRNASTVVVLAGPVPGEVLAAAGRSMNVALIRPEAPGDGDGDAMTAAADALRRAGRASSPYVLVPADPLAAVAESWRAMWDVSRSPGPDEFEKEAVQAVTAWRAGVFELPDYYLVLAADPGADGTGAGGTGTGTGAGGAGAGAGRAGDHGPDFYLGPLRSVRPHRVAVVAATEPAQQAAGVLQALGSLRHGPWWPGLDQVIDAARRFYPDSLAGTDTVLVGGDRPQTGPSALRWGSLS